MYEQMQTIWILQQHNMNRRGKWTNILRGMKIESGGGKMAKIWVIRGYYNVDCLWNELLAIVFFFIFLLFVVCFFIQRCKIVHAQPPLNICIKLCVWPRIHCNWRLCSKTTTTLQQQLILFYGFLDTMTPNSDEKPTNQLD